MDNIINESKEDQSIIDNRPEVGDVVCYKRDNNLLIVTETDNKGINASDENYYLYDDLNLVARGNVWIESQFGIAYEMIQEEKQKPKLVKKMFHELILKARDYKDRLSQIKAIIDEPQIPPH